MANCIVCEGAKAKNNQYYCSNTCQSEQQYRTYIARWRAGDANGGKGINVKTLSGHVRRYLAQKYGDACSLCGWGTVNTFTNKVPLEVDHIDGNADNNSEENLRLICPYCHSLTSSFRNLNKGSGRTWRRLKYIKST